MEFSLWAQIRGELKKRLAPHLYSSLVEPANCTSLDNERMKLDFVDTFSKESFETKCLATLHTVLKDFSLNSVNVILSVPESRPPGPELQYAYTNIPNQKLLDA